MHGMFSIRRLGHNTGKQKKRQQNEQPVMTSPTMFFPTNLTFEKLKKKILTVKQSNGKLQYNQQYNSFLHGDTSLWQFMWHLNLKHCNKYFKWQLKL